MFDSKSVNEVEPVFLGDLTCPIGGSILTAWGSYPALSGVPCLLGELAII